MKYHVTMIVMCWVVISMCGLVRAQTFSEEPALKLDAALTEQLISIARKHYPKADVFQKDDHLVIKHGTMMFTVHDQWKTGEIRPETRQVEGPNFQGFILELRIKHGKYDGPAMVPQAIHRPYWTTYIDRPLHQDGKSYFVINYSYGSRFNEELMSEFFAVLPKTIWEKKPQQP